MIVSQSAFRAEADSDHDSELSSGKFRSNQYLLAKPRTCTSLTFIFYHLTPKTNVWIYDLAPPMD